MKMLRIPTRTVIAVTAVVATAGCVSTYEPAGNEPPVREPIETAPAETAVTVVAASEWECTYVRTNDWDWHNDVLCSNGAESHRPYLLESDSYITESEILRAAQNYEDDLNGSGAVASEPGSGDSPQIPIRAGSDAPQYSSVEDLVDAAVAAGYACPAWTQTDQVKSALESGACSQDDVFSIYADSEATQAAVDKIVSVSAGYVEVGLLAGPNWIVNTAQPALGQLASRLGGNLVEVAR